MEQLPKDHFVTSMQFTKNTHQALYKSVDPANPENSLHGKIVVITGASRGIGAEGVVPAFAKAGVKAIVLVATNAEKLKAVAESVHQIYPNIETLEVAMDISSPDSVADLFERVRDKFGHADILVNNAGSLAGGGNIHEEDPAQWWTNFEVNLKGAFLLSSSFIKALPSPQTPATILNVVTGAWYVLPFLSGYLISKLAAIQLMTHLAAAYPNLTTVAVHPGLVKTDMMLEQFKGFNLDTPELSGSVMAWLATDKARFLSGRFISVNWDVDDLVARKDEIVSEELLQLKLGAILGMEQFRA
ncbi:NAD(P)-binding protein [Thozetella sp. PMI_491]|nr:NAD(P)-binding protein [Thozetella sp. PMI_491]